MTVPRLIVCLPLMSLAMFFGCGSPPEPEPVSAAPPEAVESHVEPIHGTETTEGTKKTEDPEPEPVTEQPHTDELPVPETAPPADPVRDWLAVVSSDDRAARQQAIGELEQLPNEGLPQVRRLLTDTSPEVRRGAALYLLDRFDPADAEMGRAFAAAVSDSDPLTRSLAVSALRRLGPTWVAQAVMQLTRQLDPQHEEVTTRASVARLLGSLDAESLEDLPDKPSEAIQLAAATLADASKTDPDRSVRSAALMSLARIAEPAAVVEASIAALNNDTEASVRGLAASRLQRLGPQAASAAEALAAAMEDSDEGVRSKSAEALVGLGSVSVPLLAGKLKSPSVEGRKLAIYSLIAIGPAAKTALPALNECLQDPDEHVRNLTQLAIRKLQNY